MGGEPKSTVPGSCAAWESFASLILSSLAVGSMWLITWSQGAVGISRADDWSYLLTQYDFAAAGVFVLNNWAVTMLIGQTVVAWPITRFVGEVIVWHQAYVAFFAAIGLWLTYLLIRRYLPRTWSCLAVTSLALSPIFAPSAISFMTDVPAFTLMSASLFVGTVALDRKPVSLWLLLGSLVLSLLAFTFRDYAILAGVTVVLVALIRINRSRATLAVTIGATVTLLAAAGALYWWRHSLPNDLKLSGWSFEYSLSLLGRASLTAALLISPVLVFVSISEVFRSLVRTRMLAFAAILLWAILVLLSQFQFLGNVIHPFGTSWLVSGPGVRMWPLWMNRTLILASAVFLLVLVTIVIATVARWWTSGRTLSSRVHTLRQWIADQPGLTVILVFPVLLFFTHACATLMFGTWWIDRYFILWLPFACAGLIAVSLRQKWNTCASDGATSRINAVRMLGISWVAAYFILSFHVVEFDALVDGTKWRSAEEIAATKRVSPSQIDGGMPFVAYYEEDVGIGAQNVSSGEVQPWWTARYPERQFCWTVAFAPGLSTVPNKAQLVTEFRSTFGAGGFVYVVPGPDICDSPT